MATNRSFDARRLRRDLAGLHHWSRIAFATSCVEVLVPSYIRFCELEEVGDPETVRAAVDAVWGGLQSPDEGFRGLPDVDAVSDLLPDDDDWNEWAPQAEDAIAALIYVLELIAQDDVDRAAYPAERAYAAVDELVARQQELQVLDVQGRADLLTAAAIQAELERQATALTALQGSPGDRSVVGSLRIAARRAAVGGSAD